MAVAVFPVLIVLNRALPGEVSLFIWYIVSVAMSIIHLQAIPVNEILTYTKFGSPILATHASDGFCVGVSSKAEMILFTQGELYSAP